MDSFLKMTTNTQQIVTCIPCVHSLETDVSLPSVCEVVGKQHLPAILGGNPSVQGFSIFTAEPVEVFEFALHETDPFGKLSHFLSKYQFADSCDIQSGVFCGGWIGYFGYELGRFIEKLPAQAVDDLDFPVIRLGFYDKAILFDHQIRQFILTALDYDGQKQTVKEKFDLLSNWISQAKKTMTRTWDGSDIQNVNVDTVDCNITCQQYKNAIDRIKEYIHDGDTYQINFSQRFKTDFRGRPVDIFHWQNVYNPSPFAGYMAWENQSVISASPELFLNVNGDRIVTKPIKGTRPRNPVLQDESAENQAYFHDLVLSEKDQAELAMIVDLERNDLARICKPGTRTVSCARQIESFPTVYHAVATVEGVLGYPAGPQRVIEILKATFPGGSITGAPKIRSMEIIDELEPTARSVYTGSMGWIGLDFNLCWNIAIRTILTSGSSAYAQVGGGIVADSDVQSEWQETLTKARALLAGLRAAGR